MVVVNICHVGRQSDMGKDIQVHKYLCTMPNSGDTIRDGSPYVDRVFKGTECGFRSPLLPREMEIFSGDRNSPHRMRGLARPEKKIKNHPKIKSRVPQGPCFHILSS